MGLYGAFNKMDFFTSMYMIEFCMLSLRLEIKKDFLRHFFDYTVNLLYFK